MRGYIRSFVAGVVAFAGAGAIWSTTASTADAGREAVYEIPQGTWARRMEGEDVATLPSVIRLTIGVKDVLLLKNRDDVPHVFGPALLMPGQDFRLPFEVASTYYFSCTAHASGQLTVVVDRQPVSLWARLLAWYEERRGEGYGASAQP